VIYLLDSITYPTGRTTMYTIYGLVGPDRNIRYIGVSSKDAAYVLSHHKSAAKGAKRKTPVNEWVLENEGSVSYKVIQEVEAENKASRLEAIISALRENGADLLNLTPEEHAARVKEAMSDPEVRAKISENGKGRVNSPEHRAAISEANKGRVISPEHRAIVSARHKGKVTSDETKAKIAAKAMGHKRNVGKTHTEEAKAKMSKTRHMNNHVAKATVKVGCRWCEND
jgi:hypothetical protein